MGVLVEEEARRIMALFEGYDGAYGTYGKTERNLEKDGKLEIRKTARTIREPVTSLLWEDHLAGRQPIGILLVRPDNTCMWGAIDVDRYDMDLGEVARRVSEARLPLLVCRTKSGGAHLYLFLAEPVEAAVLQKKLRDISALLGFGGSEVFPKQTEVLWDRNDVGNWLNMPYFGEERYCIGENGRGLTLRQFLTRAEGMRVTEEQLLAISTAGAAEDEFRDGPPCLQYLTTSGFPEGTRNNGLFAIGTFLRRKHPDTWDHMLEVHNQKYFHPPLPAEEVMGIIKQLKKREYKYKCSDMPLVSHCNSGLCRTRKFGVGASGHVPTMDNLAVLQTDEPIWFLDVQGHRIELRTDELLNPLKFQQRCMESIHVLMPALKRETWANIVQGLMDNLTEIEAPAEVSLTGQFFELVETFCTERQRAQDRDEIILGKAWHDAEVGRVYFRIRDLQDFMEKVRFRGMTRSQMATRIRERGGGTHFFNIKGRGANVFWLPEEVFSVQTQPHDIPDVKEEVI